MRLVKDERRNRTAIHTTTHGPVGIFGAAYEHKVPAVPPIIARTMARKIISNRREHQILADAAGVITNAAIKTAPVVCMPIATEVAAKVEINAM